MVDGLGLLRRLYPPKANWVNGGQFNQLLEAVGHFIAAFREVGFDLVVFFDGATDEIKIEEYLRRKYRDLTRISQTLEHVGKFGQQPEDVYIPPTVIREGLAQCFRFHGCSVHFSVGEADRELAAYCMENNCFGVLGFDSDFFLFDLPRYLSSESLVITDEEFRVTSYEKDKVLRTLGLESAMEFVLVGCLVGNDFMQMQDLIPFHEHMLGPGLTGWDLRWKLIVSTSRLISDIRQSIRLSLMRKREEPHVRLEEFLAKIPVVCDNPALAEAIMNAAGQYQFHSLAELTNSILLKKNLRQFPEIILQRFEQGNVTPILMSVLYRRVFMKGPILGNRHRTHCLLSTRPLRVAAYQIVFGRGTRRQGSLFPGEGTGNTQQEGEKQQPGSNSSDKKMDTFVLVNERLGVSGFTVRNPEAVAVSLDPKSDLPNFLDLWSMTPDPQFQALARALKLSAASPVWGFWVRRTKVDILAKQYKGLPRWRISDQEIDYATVDVNALFPGLQSVPDSHKLFNEPVPARHVKEAHEQVLRASHGHPHGGLSQTSSPRGGMSPGFRGRGRGRGGFFRENERLMVPHGHPEGHLVAPPVPDTSLPHRLIPTTPSPRLDSLILVVLTLGYMWTHKLADRTEVIALLYQALICATASNLEVPKELDRRKAITIDGVHIGSLFLRVAEDTLLVNNACGNPLQISGPWHYFDGTLTQCFLNCLREKEPKPPFLMDGVTTSLTKSYRTLEEAETLTDDGTAYVQRAFPAVYKLADTLKIAITSFPVLQEAKDRTPEDDRLEGFEVDFYDKLTFSRQLQNEDYLQAVIVHWWDACDAARKAEKPAPRPLELFFEPTGRA